MSSGMFHENVVINPDSKPKKLTLKINGAGTGSTVVDGGNSGHVLEVGANTTLTLSGMTITDGNAGMHGNGGGIDADHDSTLTITNCVIEGNAAAVGGGVYLGGGSLRLTDSVLSDNTALNDPDNDIGSAGGGLFIAQHVKRTTIGNSTISGNAANEGGGLLVEGGETTITASSIIANTATPIRLPSNVFFPSLGGGIFVADTSITILDSTISGNVAQSASMFPFTAEGGGIEVVRAIVTLNNVTIAGNSADRGGGFLITHGKKFAASNSIIADNQHTDCEGTVVSLGFNLLGDDTCVTERNNPTDILGGSPLLAPLALNPPGSTETEALTSGSPELKAGNPASPNGKGNHCLPTDQRGVKRVAKACDIGAYQLSL
ncbi:MAG TPA: choice-of-anchor Q domain-containing protein [Candidatus Binataceae bacterium]|nr:choice-of-anchor Q domain-containing protein [Candidatus Binataceae bacterium]